MAYCIGSRPPTITTVFKAIPDPRASKYSLIYTQSSLVGARTNA